jgi:hypothetical protein
MRSTGLASIDIGINFTHCISLPIYIFTVSETEPLKRETIIFILAVLTSLPAWGQGCLDNLYKASKFLDEGNADACLALIYPCSHEDDQSIVWQVNRLKSIAWLIKSNPDSARYAAEAMLEINPMYKPDKVRDPKEFINLLGTIYVIPKWEFGISIDVFTSRCYPQVTQGFVLADYLKTYENGSGSHYGASLGYYMNPRLIFNSGVQYAKKEFSIKYNFSNLRDSVTHRFYYLESPFTAIYMLSGMQKRWRFFMQGGLYAAYLLRSENDFGSKETNPDREYNLQHLSSTARMHRFSGGLVAGTGLFYRTGPGKIIINASFYYSMFNAVKPAKRYNYGDLMYTYFYIDDDILLHNLTLNIGYSRYLNYRVYKKQRRS